MALAAGAAPERVMVVPNAVDLERIDRALAGSERGSRDRRAAVGWVGSFGPWHGAEVLVRALGELSADVTAVMVGDGPERGACQALAREHGVDERIEWAGALPHADAIRRLALCEVLVSPHVPLEGQAFFGSPTKLFEYMALGRPIVASGLEQLAEVLEDGVTARLVRPGDAKDLARGIAAVLALPDRGRELGLAARREAETRHTWALRARSILERLTTTRPAGQPSPIPPLTV
jgi:glycosyltransferase involved in cell wall biosynthesis